MAAGVVDAARDRGLFTTITLATAFGCPFEGEVDPARVAEFARRCADSGVQELCLADTVGVGAPTQVTRPDGPGARPRRRRGWRCVSTSTTPATPASPTPTPPSPRAWTCWTRAPAGSGAARSPRRRPATSPPTTSSTCSNGWAARPGIDLKTLIPTAGFLGEQLGHEVPALLPRAGLFP